MSDWNATNKKLHCAMTVIHTFVRSAAPAEIRHRLSGGTDGGPIDVANYIINRNISDARYNKETNRHCANVQLTIYSSTHV